eukprot:TRINITY_DN1343_c3_g1_i3.p3 TRINITY_DN1343_c3_g1~~TRINITY_DN1343_c3_g1_i3.p3  ORF type:complete len:101 (+),score=21.39 TRINITY_DN1343_c3_g1_i3:44-304(+)
MENKKWENAVYPLEEGIKPLYAKDGRRIYRPLSMTYKRYIPYGAERDGESGQGEKRKMPENGDDNAEIKKWQDGGKCRGEKWRCGY